MSPLYIDLDGTLLRGDSLHEGLAKLLGRPKSWLPTFLALGTRGKAGFKQEVAQHSHLNAAALPYRADFLQWVQAQQAKDRKVYLATGADESLAQAVCQHLKLDGYLASDGSTNLTGPRKLEAIRRHAQGAPFCYAGNDKVDLPIWDAAQGVVLVADGARYLKRYANFELIMPDKTNRIADILRLLRPHQWAKNILVFLPALAAHKLFDPAIMGAASWLFGAFCLCASGVYVANDILDAEADRAHPDKSRRPIASGAVSVPMGVVLAIGLPLLALAMATQVGSGAALLVAAYWVATSLYSTWAKKVAMLDVFMLAAFYALRALAGGMAIPTGISVWMTTFLLFLFLSLAFAKRYSELLTLPDEHNGKVAGRGYLRSDAPLVAALGVSASFASTIVICLYVASPSVSALYSHPSLLIGIAPIALFGLCRFWLMASRGALHSDPVLHAIKDPVSYLLLVLVLVLAGAASLA